MDDFLQHQIQKPLFYSEIINTKTTLKRFNSFMV
jgi:hypothetical protein